MASREERAKQFLPFDALEGLREALKEKEEEQEEERILLEDSLLALQKKFNKIEIGTNIKIKYYKNKKYIVTQGQVTKIDKIKKKIILNQEEIINIDDIVELSII